MKFMRIAAAVVFAFAFGSAYAFHDGGVADCEGCHTMHNSEGGVAMTTTGGLTLGKSGVYLLQGNTQSEACLNCHNGPTKSSYHVSTDSTKLGAGLAPLNYTPGGDFGWVKKTYNWVVRVSSSTGVTTFGTSLGERHGHNIVAPAYDFAADATQTKAPGGTYANTDLQCSSCHDPHGKYRRDSSGTILTTGLPIAGSGSYDNSAAPVANVSAVGVYRLLAGKNYKPASSSYTFQQGDSPAAVAPATYNNAETNNGTGQIRVAYGTGMSEWCGNCHNGFVQTAYTSGMGGLTHPAGSTGANLTTAVAANYVAYVKTGDMTNADATKGYWTLTPVEIGSKDYDTATTGLKAMTTNYGAATTANNVMCLSCHRAHASGFDSMLRFNMTYEYVTDAGTGSTPTYAGTVAIGQGRSETEMQAAYYGRPATVFAVWQRDICNKCHAKD